MSVWQNAVSGHARGENVLGYTDAPERDGPDPVQPDMTDEELLAAAKAFNTRPLAQSDVDMWLDVGAPADAVRVGQPLDIEKLLAAGFTIVSPGNGFQSPSAV